MGARCSIFVVDDHPDIVEVVTDVLTGEGYSVETELDAVRALERIVVGPRPQVLLLDCLMPRMNGQQFLDALEREGISIPVLLFTAASRLPAELVLRAAGVINKPCGIERLLAGIEAAARPTFAGLAKCGWRSGNGAAATAATGS